MNKKKPAKKENNKVKPFAFEELTYFIGDRTMQKWMRSPAGHIMVITPLEERDKAGNVHIYTMDRSEVNKICKFLKTVKK